MSQDFETPEPTPTPAPSPAKSGPKLKIPVPPDLPDHDPEHGSPFRKLSTMVGINMLMLLTTLLALGYTIARQAQAPTAAATPSTESAKAPDVKPEVDQLKAEIQSMTKKLDERPAPTDPAPQIKSLDDKVAELGKAVADMPGRFDVLGQKLETVSKGEGLAPAPKVEAIEKKIGEIAQALDALKADLSARPAATTTPAVAAPISPADLGSKAMEDGVAFFKKGKFAEAGAAFARSRELSPDDARAWYFSALANGLATRDWKGESERLVAAGMAKEKAGSPDRAKIDAAFADLTTATGKDWLAFYRSKATQ